jgi:hypothetical protein
LATEDGVTLAPERLPFFTLDDLTTRDTILGDPVGFIRRLDRAVIDEVQRVPDVLLAIKESGTPILGPVGFCSLAPRI